MRMEMTHIDRNSCTECGQEEWARQTSWLQGPNLVNGTGASFGEVAAKRCKKHKDPAKKVNKMAR